MIKYQLGKLTFPAPPAELLPRQRDAHGISSLSITESALPHLAKLPLLHRDPFDRLLVAQAMEHGLTVATVDTEIAAYPVSLLAAS